MLVLSRKKNESIVVNDTITIHIVEIRGDEVRIGVEAQKKYQFIVRKCGTLFTHRKDKTMQTIYRANDGKEFTDDRECENYEKEQSALLALKELGNLSIQELLPYLKEEKHYLAQAKAEEEARKADPKYDDDDEYWEDEELSDESWRNNTEKGVMIVLLERVVERLKISKDPEESLKPRIEKKEEVEEKKAKKFPKKKKKY